METVNTDTKKDKPIGKAAMADVAIVSELKDLGWQVKQGTGNGSKGGQYFAQELDGDKRSLGPAASLAALKTQVMLAAGPAAAKPSKANGNGNGKAAGNGKANSVAGNGAASTIHKVPPPAKTTDQRLPTMEEPELDELNDLADHCIEAKEEKQRAVAAFKDECDLMREKMREHGRKRYGRRGFSIVIEESEKLVIKEDKQAPPMNPSTKKASGK